MRLGGYFWVCDERGGECYVGGRREEANVGLRGSRDAGTGGEEAVEKVVATDDCICCKLRAKCA